MPYLFNVQEYYDVFILFFSWLKVWVCSIVQVKVWCQLTHIHAARASQSTAWSAWVRGGPGPPLPPFPSKNLRDQTGSLTWFSDFWYHFFIIPLLCPWKTPWQIPRRRKTNFEFFSRPYGLIKSLTFIKFWNFFHGLQIFSPKIKFL